MPAARSAAVAAFTCFSTMLTDLRGDLHVGTILEAMPEESGSRTVPRLGFSPNSHLRDLWTHEDVAPLAGRLEVTVPRHGAAIFRVSS